MSVRFEKWREGGDIDNDRLAKMFTNLTIGKIDSCVDLEPQESMYSEAVFLVRQETSWERARPRRIKDNHYETRSLLVPSSFPARLKIRPLVYLN
jgi:hypothetical protein